MLQGSHLLVVDDERTTRLTLSEIFSLRGAIVSIAGSGEEALKLIEQTHFDLIILDIKMPGISGLEVLDSVHVSSPSTIVILLTACHRRFGHQSAAAGRLRLHPQTRPATCHHRSRRARSG